MQLRIGSIIGLGLQRMYYRIVSILYNVHILQGYLLFYYNYSRLLQRQSDAYSLCISGSTVNYRNRIGRLVCYIDFICISICISVGLIPTIICVSPCNFCWVIDSRVCALTLLHATKSTDIIIVTANDKTK